MEKRYARRLLDRHRFRNDQYRHRTGQTGRDGAGGRVPRRRELSDLYRSVLCFERLSASRHDIQAQAGSKAIRAYLASIYETRFIQSLKSHVASPLFDETRIFGRGYKFEDLLSVFFRHAIADADG